jgi:hypothetical protein
MFAYKSLFVASAMAAAMLIGAPVQAEARSDCAKCKSAKVVSVKTVRGKSTRSVSRASRTVYKNVRKTTYQRRIKRVVNTRYHQPVVHVRQVTRVYHQTVNLHSTRVVNKVVRLKPRTVYSNSVVHVRLPAKNVRCNCR